MELLSEIECPFGFHDEKSFVFDQDLMLFGDDEFVFEGDGQSENILGVVPSRSDEEIYDSRCELQFQISSLKFQMNKMCEECSDLRQQNASFQDENIQLLLQKEEMERKLTHRDLAQERIKQLQKELEEARHTITSLEDLSTVYNTRIQRLEGDYSELEMKNDNLKKLNEECNNDMEKFYYKLKQKDQEIQEVRCQSQEYIDNCNNKFKQLESHVTDLNQSIQELTIKNHELRGEKQELENNLVDISETQLVQLNSTSSPEESSSRSSSPGSPRFTRSLLRLSLQAEIAATIENKRLALRNTLPSAELVDAATQSEESGDEGFWSGERHKGEEQYYDQILNSLKDIRQLIFTGAPEKDAVIVADSTTENGSLIEGKGREECSAIVVVAGSSTAQDEMVRRINQELAEFRQQLKKSQELFHTMQNNGSASAVSLTNVTQSCPVLVESIGISPVNKPALLVSCSTQTDPSASVIGQQSRRSSAQQDVPIRSLLDAIDDDGDLDSSLLDKLSDDISYRLTINLPTVLEESDQETETSPGAGPRRMSSIDKNRHGGKGRLVRSTKAQEEDGDSSSNHKGEDVNSSDDFRSAISSLPTSLNSSAYNSLERPLQITGAYEHRNGDSDSASLDGNTTYGSPLSYPSSPTYWTPLEGSSSQETITNMDGDKTPVNEGNGHDRQVNSCPFPNRTEYENGTGSLRKRGCSTSSSWGPSLPIYNKNGASSVGVIPENDREHMIRYAYDPVRRSSEIEASLLPGEDWRTLRKDLDKKGQDMYRKHLAQGEGNDIEGNLAVESGCQRQSTAPDLEEEAEECLEKFPGLVEELFAHLDVLKRTQKSPTEFDLETISTRFNHLAHTFKVEHSNLTQRKDINLSNHEHATTKMESIIYNLTDVVQKFDDIAKKTKVPEEISQLTTSLKHIPGDIELYTNDLSKTSRRVGMMDVQVRLYKMIEVMVLYVHILRNLCAEKDKDFQSAMEILKKNDIPFLRTKTVASMNNNNNNNEKVSWDEGQVDEGDSKNLICGLLSDAYSTLRCELFWPWNWEDSWKGLKQGFSVILMVLGLFIIVRSLFPIVSADTHPRIDLASVFSKHGNLAHPKLPLV